MNKIRLEAGQPRLGFVNPLLYQVFDTDMNYIWRILMHKRRFNATLHLRIVTLLKGIIRVVRQFRIAAPGGSMRVQDGIRRLDSELFCLIRLSRRVANHSQLLPNSR